jgi:hypothetical protein
MMRSRAPARASRDITIGALLTASAVVPVAAFIAFLPLPLVMPSLSAVLMFLAMLASALAWTCGSQRSGDAVTIWDIAGAFAFLGCAAAIFSRPESVLRLLGPIDVP